MKSLGAKVLAIPTPVWVVGTFDKEGNQLAIFHSAEVSDDAKFPIEHIKPALYDGNKYISPAIPVSESDNRKMLIIITIPLKRSDNTLVGAISGRLLLDENGILKIPNIIQIGTEGYIYLADENGHIIAFQGNYNFYEEKIGGIVIRLGTGKRSAIPLLHIINEKQPVYGITKRKNKEMLEVLAPVEDIGWMVGLAQPSEKAFAKIPKLQRQLIMLLVMVLIISLTIALYLSFRITRPLSTLLSAVRKITEGDLNILLADNGGREIRLLTNAFNEMNKSLRHHREQLEARLDELEHINAIALKLTSVFNQEEIIRLICDTAKTIGEGTVSILFIKDEGISNVYYNSSRPLSEEVLEQLKSIISTEYISETTEQLNWDKTNITSFVNTNNQKEEEIRYVIGKIKSRIVLPLTIKNNTSGLLLSLNVRRNAFTREDHKFLSTLSSEASISLTNAQIYEEMRGQLQELSALHEVSQTITETWELDQKLQKIVQVVGDIMQAERISLMLVDKKQNRLHIRAAIGLSDNVIKNSYPEIGEGIAGWVAQNGNPLLLQEDFNDKRFADIQRRSNIHSAMIVPLLVENEIIGVLNVTNTTRNSGHSHFDEGDMALLRTIASETAIAIRNTQLYNELQEKYKELEKANSQIKETYQQLLQMEKLSTVGQMASSIAHDINNPLGTIALHIYLLKSRIENKEDPNAEHYGVIEAETDRIAKLVRTLLNFSRKSSHKILKPVDINMLIEETLLLAEYQLRKNKINCEILLSPQIPNALADKGQLMQVLINLITNAMQAMPEGGELIISSAVAIEEDEEDILDGEEIEIVDESELIDIPSKEEKRCIRITITDNGIGIPDDALPHIFEAFYTTKEENQGTGLGLSICRKIIEEDHQGKISIQTEVGVGTTFILELQIAD